MVADMFWASGRAKWARMISSASGAAAWAATGGPASSTANTGRILQMRWFKVMVFPPEARPPNGRRR